MNTKACNARCWNGLVLGLFAVAVVHLTAITGAGRVDEAWPVLLSNGQVGIDPGVAALQQRANGSLERLVQSGRVAEYPL